LAFDGTALSPGAGGEVGEGADPEADELPAGKTGL